MFTFCKNLLRMGMLLAGRKKTNFFPTEFFIRAMASATTYSLNLNSDDRKKYEEKLITADEIFLPDPYTLVENLKDNVKLLPDITWADIYNYLINTSSLYTNKNLKAYKSLEAYNFFVSGHVENHGINNLSRFCFIKSKVIIKGLSFFTSEKSFRFFEVFCFNNSQLYYTLAVTYFVFILTYSHTVLDQYGRVNSCVV